MSLQFTRRDLKSVAFLVIMISEIVGAFETDIYGGNAKGLSAALKKF